MADELNFDADRMALKKFKAMICVAESEGRECVLDKQIADYCESLQSQLAAERERADGLQAVVDAAKALLTRIGDYAHDHSTGPSEPDALWEIRSMAYNGEDLAAPVPAQPVAVPEGGA